MKKLKALIGLKVVSFGIWIYECDPFYAKILDEQDKENLRKLWRYHDEFKQALEK